MINCIACANVLMCTLPFADGVNDYTAVVSQATRIIIQRNTIFTARRVRLAQTMLWQDICLSVTRRYSVKTAKRIVKLFAPSGSHTVLVFP